MKDDATHYKEWLTNDEFTKCVGLWIFANKDGTLPPLEGKYTSNVEEYDKFAKDYSESIAKVKTKEKYDVEVVRNRSSVYYTFEEFRKIIFPNLY